MKRLELLILVALIVLSACAESSRSAAPTTPSSAEPPSSARGPQPCAGVTMRRGQRDIDANPAGTTFCLSGTNDWTLTPKSGDSFVGPAVLDGHHSAKSAFIGDGTHDVTLIDLDVRNYMPGDQEAAISAHGTNAWRFLHLMVHDNGTRRGGTGANLGVDSVVRGGRYYNNRSLGIGGGGGADGWLIDGAEVDHNNFTDNTYRARNIDCGYEGGGVKWTARNATVKNSYVHNNACKGLWADLNANGATITNSRVANNWDEGIFVEISSGATITNNTVIGNGKRSHNSPDGSGCSWLWGGGVTLSSSGGAVVSDNTLADNCNGITGVQQNRPDGDPGRLEDLYVHDNLVSGSGKSGVAADNGVDLTHRGINFVDNTFTNGATPVGGAG